MKTPEEIVANIHFITDYIDDYCSTDLEDVIRRVQIEVQKEVLDFVDWINSNDYEKIHGNRWCKKFMSVTFSTAQLYERWIDEKAINFKIKEK